MEIQRTRAAEFQRQIKAMSAELEDRNETIAKLRAEVVQQRSEQEDLRSRFDGVDPTVVSPAATCTLRSSAAHMRPVDVTARELGRMV